MFKILRDEDSGSLCLESDDDVSVSTEKEALLLSIEKWKLICAHYENGSEQPLEDGGISTCGCCFLFFSFQNPHCEGCPIYNKTGKDLCYDTPYGDYVEVIENSIIDERNFDSEEALDCAKAELKFLQDLYKELYDNK